MCKKLLAITLLAASMTANATEKNLVCIGMDGTGQTVRAIIDSTTMHLHIQDNVFKVISGKNVKYGGYALQSANFQDTDNRIVNDTFTFFPDGSSFIGQWDAHTGALIAYAEMSCHQED